MLDKRKKYLQIAFNRSLEEVAVLIDSLPLSDRIIIEAGYPLMKIYGTRAIGAIKNFWEQRASSYIPVATGRSKTVSLEPYIVADLKCMDRAFTEVEAAASAGASAATCLGLAPIETINEFIERCKELGIDSVVDMMNIEFPFEVLSQLKDLPSVVMMHLGVDEGQENREKEVPYHEIDRIKNTYDDILIATAGGETVSEVISGAFNGADILVVWKLFNESPEKIKEVSAEFLKELIR